jgi:CRP/FNR family transcriptional regulator
MPTTAAPVELDRLRRLLLFADLGDEALARLAALSRLLTVPRKQTLFSEGEPYQGMFIVLEGLAVVYKMSAEGRMLILHVCRPGDSMAKIPLFEERDAGYPAHARTTRDSEILFLPRDPFVAFLKQHSEVSWRMLQGFAAGMKEMSLQLEGVTLREVSSRLARYLLREMEAGGVVGDDEPVLTLPLAKGSIASYLGTVHETLSRTFARLIRDRVIAMDGARITVLDKEKLERLL